MHTLPVFVGIVDAEQPVFLNDEHSEFQWVHGIVSLNAEPFEFRARRCDARAV
jgi:dATP pyrophosphohydrolase